MKEVALIDSWLEGTETGEFWTSQDAKDKVIWTRRTLTTHLAEMDKHHVGTNEGENHCWKDLDEYPCDFLVTKAKRLLGVE